MASLEAGSLYLILYLTSTGGAFHWGLYHHTSDSPSEGWKYHIKQLGSGWITDHGLTRGAQKSFLLVGLLRIAKNIDAKHNQTINTIVHGIPHNVEGITCRIWTLRVIQALVAANIVRCPNIALLEQEAYAFANLHQQSASLAERPRPIGDSLVCVL